MQQGECRIRVPASALLTLSVRHFQCAAEAAEPFKLLENSNACPKLVLCFILSCQAICAQTLLRRSCGVQRRCRQSTLDAGSLCKARAPQTRLTDSFACLILPDQPTTTQSATCKHRLRRTGNIATAVLPYCGADICLSAGECSMVLTHTSPLRLPAVLLRLTCLMAGMLHLRQATASPAGTKRFFQASNTMRLQSASLLDSQAGLRTLLCRVLGITTVVQYCCTSRMP